MEDESHPDHCSGPHDQSLPSELDRLNPSTYQEASSIFRALGDEGRLKTLILISQQERCVTEIAEALGENLAAVSQRLKLLRSERIVISRRDGKHIYYSLADHHIVDLIANGLAHAQEPKTP